MSDYNDELDAMSREVGSRRVGDSDGRTVVMRRSYRAPVEDVWDAITDPERISRWFLPVTGDFRVGGKYQIQGNAGGEILHCEPPRLLRVTWVYGEGGGDSEVEVRLSPGGHSETVFELEHAASVDPEMWGRFGPGAVGVGWDLLLLGLSLHLAGGSIEDPEAWQQSAEARDLMTRSSQAWGAAYAASGASEAEVAAAVENTTEFYVPSGTGTEPEDTTGRGEPTGTQ